MCVVRAECSRHRLSNEWRYGPLHDAGRRVASVVRWKEAARSFEYRHLALVVEVDRVEARAKELTNVIRDLRREMRSMTGERLGARGVDARAQDALVARGERALADLFPLSRRKGESTPPISMQSTSSIRAPPRTLWPNLAKCERAGEEERSSAALEGKVVVIPATSPAGRMARSSPSDAAAATSPRPSCAQASARAP